jgi:hypothetical protein
MRQVFGWVLLVALCCGAEGGAREERADARRRRTRPQLADTLALYTHTFALSEQRLRQEALDFSESRLGNFLQALRAEEQALYALLRAHPADARVRRLALSAVLLRKGRSVEETADISRTLYRSLGAEDRDTFERLRGLRSQLATLSLEDRGALTPEAYQQRLETLADESDRLEVELARRSAPLRALTALPPPSEIVDRVAASLPRDGALVEFVAYGNAPPLLPGAGALPRCIHPCRGPWTGRAHRPRRLAPAPRPGQPRGLLPSHGPGALPACLPVPAAPAGPHPSPLPVSRWTAGPRPLCRPP